MIKVTLSNGENDELELGPFNQGVVFNRGDLVDVASSKKILIGDEGMWWPTEAIGDGRAYHKVFIQQVPLSEQRMILGAELDVMVMERPHCPAARGTCSHDHCRRIEQARARYEEIM